jgi:hypothetical protein
MIDLRISACITLLESLCPVKSYPASSSACGTMEITSPRDPSAPRAWFHQCGAMPGSNENVENGYLSQCTANRARAAAPQPSFVTLDHFLVDAPRRSPTIHSAMAPSYTLASEAALREARIEVVQWLRTPSRFPTFPALLAGLPDDQLARKHPEIAEQLRAWLGTTDFQLEIVSLGEHGNGMYEGRWTHKGADFVGFKQPDPATNVEDAVILACAALLRNDWCRARLPSV